MNKHIKINILWLLCFYGAAQCSLQKKGPLTIRDLVFMARQNMPYNTICSHIQQIGGYAPESLTHKDKFGKIALHYAAENNNIALIDLFLTKLPLLVNVPDRNGNTALHYAAQNINYDLIVLLISFGADTNAVNINKESPLHMLFSKFSGNTILKQ